MEQKSFHIEARHGFETEDPDRGYAQRHIFDRIEPYNYHSVVHGIDFLGKPEKGGVCQLEDSHDQDRIMLNDRDQFFGIGIDIGGDLQNTMDADRKSGHPFHHVYDIQSSVGHFFFL
jgi:hypothetical protein